MIALLILAAIGFGTLPLWPEDWRVGLVAGWSLSIALEAVLLVHRQRDVRSGSRDLLASMVFGFLAKLAIIAAGGILGAYAGWYEPAPFLLSFVAGVVAGEVAGLASLGPLLRSRAARPSGTPPQTRDPEHP